MYTLNIYYSHGQEKLKDWTYWNLFIVYSEIWSVKRRQWIQCRKCMGSWFSSWFSVEYGVRVWQHIHLCLPSIDWSMWSFAWTSQDTSPELVKILIFHESYHQILCFPGNMKTRVIWLFCMMHWTLQWFSSKSPNDVPLTSFLLY